MNYRVQQLIKILNAFCPTGEGGGRDNSCSASGGGGSGSSGGHRSDIGPDFAKKIVERAGQIRSADATPMRGGNWDIRTRSGERLGSVAQYRTNGKWIASAGAGGMDFNGPPSDSAQGAVEALADHMEKWTKTEKAPATAPDPGFKNELFAAMKASKRRRR